MPELIEDVWRLPVARIDAVVQGATQFDWAEQALRQRSPLAVLVDDIQHMGSKRKLLDQIGVIKSIANLTRTTHILTSTYQRRQLNGQMNRFCAHVEFKRYLVENREHQEAFINCLQTFQKHLPLARTPELVKEWDYFYERCIGCIGVLKNWLTRALALALDDGGKSLANRDIQRCAHSVAQSFKMLTEATEAVEFPRTSVIAKQLYG